MKPIEDITALVIDNGIFLPTALKLAESYKRVYYWSPCDRAFPTVSEHVVGSGFEKLIRVHDIWQVRRQLDLAVFLDVGYAGLQQELVEQGVPVWGSRGGYHLETNRGKFLQTLSKIGLEVPEYAIVHGLTELREHLKEIEDRYVKISKYRGDLETFHWRSWAEDQGVLDLLATRLGPARDMLNFYVFDPIDSEIEDGVDTFCIDGQLPGVCLHAVEAKDKALLGTMMPFKDIPEVVREVTEKFAPVLAEYGCRQFFSTEVRITKDGTAYFIDPTIRAGSPPSQLQTELFANLAELIWQGANGVCLDPEPAAQFGVQVELSVKRDPGEWAVAKIPDELRRWVKCGCACGIDGLLCIPPNEWMKNEFGWLVATGDTIESAIDKAKELAGLLPQGVDCDLTSLAGLLEEAQAMDDAGVPLTEEQTIPEPASVI